LSKFKFIDLFCGVGGFRIPFCEIGGECVFSSDIDIPCQETYEANYGERPHGDITKIDPSEIPAHDLLTGGFPCQPFSTAGLKKGFADSRGEMFFYLNDIIKYHLPKVFVLENVKGLVSHDEGRTLKFIHDTLSSHGYIVTTKVLNSKDFGVPQSRERIFFVGLKNAVFDFPEPPCTPTRLGDILEAEVSPKLTLSDRLWAYMVARKAKPRATRFGCGHSAVTEDTPYTRTITRRYHQDGQEILLLQDGKNPRKLSPREAARLQGYPESFMPHRVCYKALMQMGNSVTVPVVRAIAQKLKKVLCED
jgi:DNA (cytosine-5)-methyltransferase 1